jgi:hypothetical protein
MQIVNFAVLQRYLRFISLSIGMLLCLSLILSYPSVVAQNSGIANQYKASQGAIIEKISDKGNYRVQIMLNRSSLMLPKQGFDMEIDFLNASAPLPTSKTVPQRETGIRSESPLGGSVNQIPTPSILTPTVPVDSYDIAIYTDHGKVLWKKLNQPVMGGRGLQRVLFPNADYVGGITIQITNIKSGNISPNAVTFTAKVA